MAKIMQMRAIVMIVRVSGLYRANSIPFQLLNMSEIAPKKGEIGLCIFWDKLVVYPELTVTSTLYVPCSVTSMPQSRLPVAWPLLVA